MNLTKIQQSNLKQARTMLENILKECDVTYKPEVKFTSVYIAADYCRARIGLEEREVFSVLFLDNQNKLIKAEELFLGTINQASVYPREIVKTALLCNAAAVMISHNHPSGELNPSISDKTITKKIKEALNLVDIRLLDHIIVSHDQYYSFCEENLL